MPESEKFDQKRAVNRCDSCGEALYDGDTAYRITDRTFCPACIESSVIVCRTSENIPHIASHIMTKNIMIDSIPHREISVKTREKARKITAYSKIQKG